MQELERLEGNDRDGLDRTCFSFQPEKGPLKFLDADLTSGSGECYEAVGLFRKNCTEAWCNYSVFTKKKVVWEPMLEKIKICVSHLFCVILFAACSSESQVFFQSSLDLGNNPSLAKDSRGEAISLQESFPMEGLNGNGKKGSILNPEKSAYIYLAVNEEQLPHVVRAQEQWGGVSCQITLVPPLSQKKDKASEAFSGENPSLGNLAFGFLYQSDFTDSRILNKSLAGRPLARCVTPLESDKIPSGDSITISMVIPADAIKDFRGILLYSTMPVSIASVGLKPMEVGFAGNDSHSFSSQGGVWDRSKTNMDFDFTLAKKDFEQAATSTRFPLMSLLLASSPAMPEKTSQQPQVHFEIGGESIRLRRAPNQQKASFPRKGLENPFGSFSLLQGEDMVKAVSMTLESVPLGDAGRVVEPLVTDPGMIPLWNKSSWRHKDYELFEWEQFPGILFFDTADYKVQDDFFKRLAFYTEKTGYIGTLVQDKELEGKHGFNAHDYRSETLAAFFSLAEATNFPLNEKEALLKDILLHNGIIKKAAGGGYESGYGAIISISQESAMYLRYTFVAHEGFHGIFFVDKEFRDTVAAVYQSADQKSLQFLHRFFTIQDSLTYNLDDTYLMHNEFMAYVMQQSVAKTGAYFADNLAQRGSMLRAEPELCAYVRDTKGVGFTGASQVLSNYVFQRWGIEAGRVSLVSR